MDGPSQAALAHEYIESTWCACAACVIVHFIGAASGSTNIAVIIRRICHELVRRFSLDTALAEDYK